MAVVREALVWLRTNLLGGAGATFHTVDPNRPATFDGLRAYLDDATDRSRPLHVVLMHGMGHGVPGATDDDAGSAHASSAASAVHLLAGAIGPNAHVTAAPTPSRFGEIRVFRFDVAWQSEPRRRMIVHEVNYAGYFAFRKAALPYGQRGTGPDKNTLFDDDELLLGRAASWNAVLKRNLVTWGLADATTYLHPKKRAQITKRVVAALRAIEAAPSRSAPPSPPDAPPAPDSSAAPGDVLFITHSLGSKVLFDALAHMYRLTPPGPPSPLLKAIERGNDRDLLRRTRAVFMLANQLPLLELGTWPATTSPATSWESLLSGDTTAPLPSRLDLVAFSDPNDLLTFRIGPTVARYTTVNPKLEISAIDVVLPIARRFLVFANPLRAHTGHLGNRAVLSLLAEGRRYPEAA